MFGALNGTASLFRIYGNSQVLTSAQAANNYSAFLTPGAQSDTATVTVTVTGENDAPTAVDDIVDGGFEDAAFTSTAANANGVTVTTTILDNDGIVEGAALSYDAGSGVTDVWQNTGTAGAPGDWELTGVALNTSPGSAHAGINSSLTFDGTTSFATLAGLSPQDIAGISDSGDVTLETWIKPAALGQTATILEIGGGTGTGIVLQGNNLNVNVVPGGTTGVALLSYDLNADPLGLLGAGATAEFFQVMMSVDNTNDTVELFVNGTSIGKVTAPGIDDWDGGDPAGLGRFGGVNTGAFENASAGKSFDTYYNGEIAAVRLYTDALNGADALQNYKAVSGNTDIDGDAIVATGVLDATSTLQTIGNQATLASGALVTMDDARGTFTYDPNGQFDYLAAGETATDTFTYQISEQLSAAELAAGAVAQTDTAVVTITIHGRDDAVDDMVTAHEDNPVTFHRNDFLANDNIGVSGDGLLAYDTTFTFDDNWRNGGEAGSTFDADLNGATIGDASSAQFASIVQAYTFDGVDDGDATVPNIHTFPNDPTDNSATFEVLFKPDATGAGQQVLFETGGYGIGSSVIYDAATGNVVVTVDGGDAGANRFDPLKTLQVSGAVGTADFSHVVAVYTRDGAGGDTLELYINNTLVPATGTDTFTSNTDGTGIANNGGNADDWSGTDGIGIGILNFVAALNETPIPFKGQMAKLAVHGSAFDAAAVNAAYTALTMAQPQKIIAVGPSANGATVTLNADESVTYTPTAGLYDTLAAGETTTDTFTYTIHDGAGGSSTATVTVTIEGENDLPVANNDANTATEPGGTLNGTPGVNPTGNVLGGPGAAGTDVADTDIDSNDIPDSNPYDGSVAVTNIVYSGTGTPVGANAGGAVAGATTVDGEFGTLTINPNGAYSYAVNPGASDVLDSGDTVTEVFTYDISDNPANSVANTGDLLLRYTFEGPDSTADGLVTDVSGNGNNGTLSQIGSGTNFTYEPDVAANAVGGQSLALNENGTATVEATKAARVLADTDGFDFNNNSWTVSGWYNRAETDNHDFILHMGSGDGFGNGNELYVSGVQGSDDLTVSSYFNNPLDASITVAGAAAAGTWHHFSLVHDDATSALSIYVDGAAAGSATLSGLNLNNSLNFGGHDNGSFQPRRWFNGSLDDLSVVTRALDATEIGKLANGADFASFATLSVALEGANDAPVANPDTNTITETGGSNTGEAATTGGNVLSDGTADFDNDDEDIVVGAGANVPVTNIAFSGTQFLGARNAGGAVTVGGTDIDGAYGTLNIKADGTYSYALNDTAVDTLDDGESPTETFTYTITDPQGGTGTATLTITVNGTNDDPIAVDDDYTATYPTDEDTILDVPAGASQDYSAAVLADGALVYLPFGEDFTTNLGSLGAAADGTLIGAVDALSDGPVDDGAAINMGSTAAGGTNGDGVRVDFASGFPTGTVTTEVWVRSDATNAGKQMAIVSYAQSSSHNNEVLVFTAGSTLRTWMNQSEVNTGVSTADFIDGEWHHLAVTYDDVANEVAVFVDGEEKQRTTHNGGAISASGTLILGQEQDSVGGGFADSQKFIGDLADFALYGTALTQADLLSHATAKGVLTNDIDVDGEAIAVTGIQSTASLSGLSDLGATVTMAADGSFRYDPTKSAYLQTLVEGEVVQDTFTYTISDGDATDSATVTIEVTGRGAIEIGMTNDFPPASFPANPGDDTVADTVNVAMNGANLDIVVNGVLLRSIPGSAIGSGTGVDNSGAPANANGKHDILFDGSGDAETLNVGSLGNNLFDDVFIDTAGGTDLVNFTAASTIQGELTVTAERAAIEANLTTGGNQTYNAEVTTSQAAVTLTTGAAGEVTFNGNLTGNDGVVEAINVVSPNTNVNANFDVDINGTASDTLAVGGADTVTLDAASTLTVTDSTAAAVGSTIVLIDNAGTDAVIGRFDTDTRTGTTLVEGATVTDDEGDEYIISYAGNDGNDVVLFAGTAETQVELVGNALEITDITNDSTDTLTVTFDNVAQTYTIVETNGALVISTLGLTSAQVSRPNAQTVVVRVDQIVGGVTGLTADTTGPAPGVEDGDSVTIDTTSAPMVLSAGLNVISDDIIVNGDATLTGGTVVLNASAATGGTVTMADGALIDAGSGTIDVDAGGDVTLGGLQTTSSVSVDTANGNIIDGGDAHKEVVAANAVLNAPNGSIGSVGPGNALETQISNLEGSSGTDFAIDNMGALNIGGANAGASGLDVDGNLSITNNDAITDSEAVTVDGTTTIAAGTNNVTLDNATNDFGGAVNVTANDVSLDDVDDINLGNVTAGGFLNVDTGGAVNVSGPVTVTGTADIDSTANGGPGDISGAGVVNITGTTTLNAGTSNIALNNTGNDFVGAVTVTAATNVALDDTNSLTLDNVNAAGNLDVDTGGNVDITGTVDVNGNADIDTIANSGSTGGTITDSGAGVVTIDGTTTLDAGDQDITLDNAANDFSGPVNITNANNASLDDANGINLGNINTANDLNVDAGGDVVVSGTVNVDGNLDIETDANNAAGGTITDTTGSLDVEGTSDLDAGAANDIVLDSANNDFTGAVSVNTANNVELVDRNAIDLGASTIQGNLDVLAGGAITDSGVLDVEGDACFETTGANADITLDQLDVTGQIGLNTAGAGSDATIVNVGPVMLKDTAVAGNLDVTAGGDITDTGTVEVGGTTDLDANGNDVILDTTANDFTGPVNVTNATNVTLDDKNAINLGNIAATGNLDVDSGGNVTVTGTVNVDGSANIDANANGGSTGGTIADTGAGVLDIEGATTLDAGDQNVALDNANNDFTGVVNVTNAANVALDDQNELILGNVNTAGNLDVDTAGSVEVTGTVAVGGDANIDTNANGGPGGTISDTGAGRVDVEGSTTLDANGNDIALDNAGNDFTGAVSIVSGGDVTLVDQNAIDLGNSNVSGNLNVDAGGAITDSGTLDVNGSTTLDANGNPITLDTATNDFTGPVSIVSGGNVTLVDQNAIDLGDSNVNGNLNVDATQITDSGTVDVNGSTTLDANGGNITLDTPTNDFTGPVSIVSAGNVNLVDQNALNLGASNIAGNLDVLAGGNVTDSGTISVGGNACVETTTNIVLDQLDVAGFIGLTAGGNATAVNTGTVRFKDTTTGGNLNVIATTGDIVIGPGTDIDAGGAVSLTAEDDFTLAAGGSITAASVDVRIDAGDVGEAPGTGGTANVLGSISTSTTPFAATAPLGQAGTRITGGAEADTFNITPSRTTSFMIAGAAPTTLPGDVLNIVGANGNLNPAGVPGSGVWEFNAFSGLQGVAFSSIEGDNVQPVLTGGVSTVHPEGAGPIAIFPNLVIEQANLITGAIIRFTGGYVPSEDLIYATVLPQGISVEWDPTTGSLIFTTTDGGVTAAAMQEALRSVVYDNIRRVDPTAGPRSFFVVVFDGTIRSNFIFSTIEQQRDLDPGEAPPSRFGEDGVLGDGFGSDGSENGGGTEGEGDGVLGIDSPRLAGIFNAFRHLGAYSPFGGGSQFFGGFRVDRLGLGEPGLGFDDFDRYDIGGLPLNSTLTPFFAGTADAYSTIVVTLHDEISGFTRTETVMVDGSGHWTAAFAGAELESNRSYTVTIQEYPVTHQFEGAVLPPAAVGFFNGSVIADGLTDNVNFDDVFGQIIDTSDVDVALQKLDGGGE